MTAVRNAMLALALTGAATAAHAGVKASAVTTAVLLNTSTPAEVFVPLNDAAATTLSFKLNSAGKKVLTYSAECAVSAPLGNSAAWLDLDIYVNGVIVAPTVGSSDAFCTSDGTAIGADSWVRASITLVIQGVSGDNTIRIKARGNNGALGLWLGESALVVYD